MACAAVRASSWLSYNAAASVWEQRRWPKTLGSSPVLTRRRTHRPVDMFVSSRDGGTCMGGNGTCCGMITGVSCSLKCTVFLVLDRPMMVYLQHEEVAWGSSSAEDAGGGNSGCT